MRGAVFDGSEADSTEFKNFRRSGSLVDLTALGQDAGPDDGLFAGNGVGSDLPCEAFPTRIAPAGHHAGVVVETINVGANRREAPATRGAVVERNGNFGETSDLESSVGAAVPFSHVVHRFAFDVGQDLIHPTCALVAVGGLG